MIKKNELKNLIYIQENEQCNEQTVKGLFRSIVEPVLETNTECIVLLRLEDKSKKDYNSILKRLNFSSAKVYDFSDIQIDEKYQYCLKEQIWDKTEFVYVLAERYGACFIFDYQDAELDNFASFYLMHNSKTLTDAFSVINANSLIDLSDYEAKWKPDRRENEVLNLSIRKIVANLNETNQEVMISQMEQKENSSDEDAVSRLEFMLSKSSYIAHEMRNILSISNLYSEIVEKNLKKISITDENVKKSLDNATDCVKKSLKMANNMLLDFKSLRNVEIKEYSLTYLINSALELSKAYSTKNIVIRSEIKDNIKVMADEEKFLAVLINLVKNAVESIEEKGEITITSKTDDEVVRVTVSNNGKPIEQSVQQNIFKEGFTTKSQGNGLGLVICKKTMEEQFGSLSLKKSDENSTEFELTVLKA